MEQPTITLATELELYIGMHNQVLNRLINEKADLEYFTKRRESLKGHGAHEDKEERASCEQNIKRLKRSVVQDSMYLEVIKEKIAESKQE